MDLVRLVREDFGIPLIGVQPTGLGADARAVLFRGVTSDGRAYAVKSSSAPQPGLAVADFLARQGVPGVPAPVPTLGGALCSDGGVSVAPWIEGSRAIDTGLDRAQWRAFGDLLGAVHATAPGHPLVRTGPSTASAGPPAPADLALPGPLLPVDGHDPSIEVERARGFTDRLRRAQTDAPGDVVHSELAVLWERSRHDVLAVADLAEETARSPVFGSAPLVICHADPHHGNLLLDDAGGVWLVDWDDGVFAPREADLIFVIGGVYSFAPIITAEMGWFFDGYSSASGGVTRADLDAERLTYYRSLRALTDFLDFADEALDGDLPEPERADALRIAAGALSPTGIVALTLSEAAAGH